MTSDHNPARTGDFSLPAAIRGVFGDDGSELCHAFSRGLRNFGHRGSRVVRKTMLIRAMPRALASSGAWATSRKQTVRITRHEQHQISTQLRCCLHLMGRTEHLYTRVSRLHHGALAAVRVSISRSWVHAQHGSAWAGAGVELRDGLRHSEGHRIQRGGRTEAHSTSLAVRPRALRPKFFRERPAPSGPKFTRSATSLRNDIVP